VKESIEKLVKPSQSGTYAAHIIQGFPVYEEDSQRFLVSDGLKHFDGTIFFTGGEAADGTLVAFLVPEAIESRKGPKSFRSIFRAGDGSFSIVTATFPKIKLVRFLSPLK
jgi:hypothetical protein